MKIKDLIKNKDYDYIEWRVTLPDGSDTFFGATSSKNGKLISLDRDTYSDQTEILSYKEWSQPEDNIQNGLTVVIKGVWS